MKAGTIQESRAAVRNGSRKARVRVKPSLSREAPETAAQNLQKLTGGRNKLSVGATEDGLRWTGNQVLGVRPQVCWDLVLCGLNSFFNITVGIIIYCFKVGFFQKGKLEYAI